MFIATLAYKGLSDVGFLAPKGEALLVFGEKVTNKEYIQDKLHNSVMKISLFMFL